jgi:hypothetical protein
MQNILGTSGSDQPSRWDGAPIARFPGTSCQATLIASLWDRSPLKIHAFSIWRSPTIPFRTKDSAFKRRHQNSQRVAPNSKSDWSRSDSLAIDMDGQILAGSNF